MAIQPRIPHDRLPYFDPLLDCYRLPLADGSCALIDSDDVPLASRWCWHRRGRETVENGNRCSLARMILGMKPNDGVRMAFADDDPLNCRRRNLMACGRSEFLQRLPKCRTIKTSRFKGVVWEPDREKWRAKITIFGVRTHIGRFDDEVEAAEAYDEAAIEHFGEFARLNFPRPVSA